MGDVAEEPLPILLDACCLLNLAATGRMVAILRDHPGRFAVAERVVAETLYLRRGGKGDDAEEREAIDLTPLIAAGLLTVLRVDTRAEAASLIDFADQLDDGEAMTCALALHRGFVVGTDDRKARRLCDARTPSLATHITSMLLRAWVETMQVSDAELGPLLRAIRERARFVPGRNDPLLAWWDAVGRQD